MYGYRMHLQRLAKPLSYLQLRLTVLPSRVWLQEMCTWQSTVTHTHMRPLNLHTNEQKVQLQ
jgi:hypothetical protein